MRSTIGNIALSAFVLTCMMTVSLVSANNDVVSNAIIHRAGLQVEWFTHSGAGTRDSLVDWHLFVNENKPTTYFTIRTGNYRETFSGKKLDPFGKPLGMDGLVEYAALRKEILTAEFKNEGVEDPQIRVDQYTLPESTLYLLTSTGEVKAIDADSGKQQWQTRIGDPGLASIGVGADGTHVAAINGSTMYCLDAETGKRLWSIKCRHAVSAPPTVSDEKVYVPLVNGNLEVFNIEKKGVQSSVFVASGEGLSRPLLTEVSVSWSTDAGHLNVAGRFDGKTVAYQLRADDSINSQAAYKSGKFFATSLDGFVYAVDENRGSVAWQSSTGASISQSAMPLGKHVFVINDNHELHKFDQELGTNAAGWEKPRTNIAKFVGAGRTNLYVLDRVGNLKVLSQTSGATLSSVPFGSVDKILSNKETDRLYIASRRGAIQCIRETASSIPHFHENEFGVVEIDPADMAAKAAMNKNKAMKPKEGDLDDPFKSLDDPFAAKPKMGDDADPFAPKKAADEDDPFAPKSGGATPDEADPFAPKSGGGAKPDEKDPFAGNSSDVDPFK